MISITEIGLEMSVIKFEMRQVDEKRKKTYLKVSRYDPIIDQFVASGEKLVEISVVDKKAPYVATQLKKRIEARELVLEMEASAAAGFVYLEKITTVTA